MHTWTLAFLGGLYLLTLLKNIPNIFFITSIFTLSVFLFYFLKKYKNLFFKELLFFVLGFSWASFLALTVYHYDFPKDLENKPIYMIGTISSIPIKTNFGIRFDFKTQDYDGLKVRLTWPHHSSKQFKVGQQWKLLVKLKRIHGFLNPGGDDYEKMLFMENIQATGFVLKASNISNHHPIMNLSYLRQSIATNIQRELLENPFVGIIAALAVGERSHITPEQWRVFSATGTNHLVVIAGLHIGICTIFTYFIFAWAWRRSAILPLMIPTPIVATIASLIVAFIYAALAGFSVPTLRALIMVMVYMMGVIFRIRLPALHAYFLALFFILIIEPFSILSAGFWMSYSAVFIIIYAMNYRLSTNSLWWRFGRVQWVIGIGLIPLTMLYFHNFSFSSFFVNSLAIPWIGFLVEPLSILGAITSLFNQFLSVVFLKLAAWLLASIWPIITWFSNFSTMTNDIYLENKGVFFSLLMAVLLFLAPKGWPGKYLGLIFYLPFFYYQPSSPKPNQLWMSLLDVGQGLSVVLQTAHHVLVFDTGPKFSNDFNTGKQVIVPFLKHEGIKKIDKLYISHGDNDHRGGVGSVLQSFKVQSIETSVPDLFPKALSTYCKAGRHWRWDGVEFENLYPTQEQLNLDNNSSCVLLIKVGTHKILLTGDIEKPAEKYLLMHNVKQLKAEILVVPHHGSITSSTEAFVEAVHPRYALFATGYLNRFHFPNPIVLARYKKMHVKMYNTAETGAVIFKISADKSLHEPDLYRFLHQRIWTHSN
ncbi:MAG: DNA internalization-related competence protein ComEC/Rec2 [Gammaproteobacteria bacterium]